MSPKYCDNCSGCVLYVMLLHELWHDCSTCERSELKTENFTCPLEIPPSSFDISLTEFRSSFAHVLTFYCVDPEEGSFNFCKSRNGFSFLDKDG